MKHLITQLSEVNDRLEFHPMGDTLSHVKLVALKATLLTNNRSVIAAAWLHDICKHPQFGGEQKRDSNGVFYWSNKDHAKQASELILSNDDIRYHLRDFKAHEDTVIDIVRCHMSVKDGIPKKYRSIPFINIFRICDDDVNRYQQINATDNGVYFVGLSDLNIYFGCKEFTITKGRNPQRFPISKMGDFTLNLF